MLQLKAVGPALAAVVLVQLVACSQSASNPQSSPTQSTASSPTTSNGAASSASPQPGEPTALKFRVSAIATGLEAPWSLDFAHDGSIWLTERPGRVRIIRNGTLLPQPALTVNVFSEAGCEAGLLGIAVREPYAYLYYTYSGPNGHTNRVSRFTISGDSLVGEKVILDAIPGGTCFHFGGRIKFGPDGRLYITTGEGFVASRAATPTGLSGKVLSVNADGAGLNAFAWGFRNPQGLAFDPQGRLYASNNGPTGEFGLCCHDSVYYVRSGRFYGWPAWAGNVATGYGGLPARTPPIAESGDSVWAPSGIAFYTPDASQRPTLLVSELRGQALRRLVLDPNDPSRVVRQEIVLQGYGRLRDVVAGPDSCAYVLTSNRDGRGSPAATDDRLLKLCV